MAGPLLGSMLLCVCSLDLRGVLQGLGASSARNGGVTVSLQRHALLLGCRNWASASFAGSC